MRIQYVARSVLVSAAFVALAFAQEFRASVSGTVRDPSGANIVGAQVAIAHVEKNTTSEAETNEVGFYSVPFLLPGRYSLQVEAGGFKKFIREDIVLGVNDRLAVNVSLELGPVAEAVTVIGQVAMLQTETASRGGAVEQQLVENLPNAGRNMFQLVFAMPGVYKPSTSQGNSFDIGSGIGNANPSINGASQGINGRQWNTEVLVDGLADNRSSRDVVTVPGLETVQELQC